MVKKLVVDKIFVSPPNSHVEILIPPCDGIGRRGLWRVIKA